MLHRGKVAHHQKSLLRLFRLADKHNDIVLAAGAVHPLEPVRIIIQLVQRRMLPVKVVQILHIRLCLLVDIILKKIPRQTLIFIPLGDLPHLLAHKQKLLARMGHHEAVGRP